MTTMLFPPADRIATRRETTIDPSKERQRIAALLSTLAPNQHYAAAEFAAEWPRLVHKLARRGELAAPAPGRAR
ncbi:MAG: hypothetical protein NW206_01395 [Hyphomonadaceae bacterium]|nr:hypothetical protein [Hyphomonadaceae bacterium]